MNNSEPTFDVAPTGPPYWFSTFAKSYCRRVAPQLVANGLLTKGDYDAFCLLCETYGDYRVASETTKTEGILKGKGKHPAYNQKLELARLYISLASEFGLTPAARAKIRIDDTKDGDDLDTFLNNGQSN